MCASLPIRAERRENGSEFVETLNADLGLSERHARAVAGVKHPVRELAAKVRPFVRIDERQVLAATKRRDMQRASEQRMPAVGDRRKSKSVCRMSIIGRDGHGSRTGDRSADRAATPPAPARPGLQNPCACRYGRLQATPARRSQPGSRLLQRRCQQRRPHRCHALRQTQHPPVAQHHLDPQPAARTTRRRDGRRIVA